MSKYIDANILYKQFSELEAEALEQLSLLNPEHCNKGEWIKWSVILNERTSFKHDIADAPAANVEKVVRCKDCIYLNYIFGTDCNIVTCSRTGLNMLDGNGFCSWGEKKKGGEENGKSI